MALMQLGPGRSRGSGPAKNSVCWDIYIFIISNLVHEVLDEFPKHNSGAVFFWNQSRVYKNTCKQGVWKIGMIIEGFQLFKV